MAGEYQTAYSKIRKHLQLLPDGYRELALKNFEAAKNGKRVKCGASEFLKK